jgi:hypothetical protein
MKSFLIPVDVDSEENLHVLGYRVDMKWSDKERPNNPDSPATWSEYYFAPELNLAEIADACKSSFEPDIEVLKVEEIKITAWGIR